MSGKQSGHNRTPVGESGEGDHSAGSAKGRETPTIVIPRGARPPPVLVGLEDSQYRILGEIGHGGMSVVYLARDVKLGRHVAIKRLNPEFLTDPAMRNRFRREAQLIAALNHIYIVKLYDFDIERTDPRIIMEYVAGPGKPPAPDWPASSLNLEQKLDQNGAPLTLRASVMLVRKLCLAMEYAHRNGVVHRDLKPSNILLDEHGEPRLVDFGIARQMVADSDKLTLTGARMLSLGYAAPEQETAPATADARADVYSLGGILYFCLTGENPRFFRDSRVPESLRPIILKAMEREPEQRWSSARDLAEVLSQSAGDLISPLTDPGMWRCKWCNSLNPVANRYCAQCNWDGMESCPECGTETRVGVRFCGRCSTDIKAFEDMRALLARLRDYRRTKEFQRIKDAMDGGNAFQPRGDKGQEMVREIRELGETALWAIQRKDELVQAISAGLDRQNYEEVRDRLNEYGVLDDGPGYSDLRRELPWRIAERNIVLLRGDLAEARRQLGGKRPGEAARRLADIENRLLSLAQIESQFPPLQGALTAATDPSSSSGRGSYARVVAMIWKDVEQAKAEVEAARQAVERMLQAASLAFKAQDYEGCLRTCEALQEISIEPSPAESLAEKAKERILQIDRMIARADDAIRRGNLKSAERSMRDLLERWKQDSRPARQRLDQIRRIYRIRRFTTAGVALVVGMILYGFSIGPVYRSALRQGGLQAAQRREALNAAYAPVFWLHERTPLKGLLDRYAAQWEPTIFGRK